MNLTISSGLPLAASRTMFRFNALLLTNSAARAAGVSDPIYDHPNFAPYAPAPTAPNAAPTGPPRPKPRMLPGMPAASAPPTRLKRPGFGGFNPLTSPPCVSPPSHFDTAPILLSSSTGTWVLSSLPYILAVSVNPLLDSAAILSRSFPPIFASGATTPLASISGV